MIDQGYSMACWGCPYKRKADDYDSEQSRKNQTCAKEIPLTREQKEKRDAYEANHREEICIQKQLGIYRE